MPLSSIGSLVEMRKLQVCYELKSARIPRALEDDGGLDSVVHWMSDSVFRQSMLMRGVSSRETAQGA